jgi:hypothetical protein
MVFHVTDSGGAVRFVVDIAICQVSDILLQFVYESTAARCRAHCSILIRP